MLTYRSGAYFMATSYELPIQSKSCFCFPDKCARPTLVTVGHDIVLNG